MDRGQALGYARALWAGAWARYLIPQALIPSLSGSGDTLFSLSWKSRVTSAPVAPRVGLRELMTGGLATLAGRRDSQISLSPAGGGAHSPT